jgi:hypothetical protein
VSELTAEKRERRVFDDLRALIPLRLCVKSLRYSVPLWEILFGSCYLFPELSAAISEFCGKMSF